MCTKVCTCWGRGGGGGERGCKNDHLPGRYSLEEMRLSIIPPVLPILKQPGFIPPTCVGEGTMIYICHQLTLPLKAAGPIIATHSPPSHSPWLLTVAGPMMATPLPPSLVAYSGRAYDGHTPPSLPHWLLTVAGPMMVTPFCLASLFIFLVRFSGMPSAMIEITRNWQETQ